MGFVIFIAFILFITGLLYILRKGLYCVKSGKIVKGIIYVVLSSVVIIWIIIRLAYSILNIYFT